MQTERKYSRFPRHVPAGQRHTGDGVVVFVARVTVAVLAVNQPEGISRVPGQERHITLNDRKKGILLKLCLVIRQRVTLLNDPQFEHNFPVFFSQLQNVLLDKE